MEFLKRGIGVFSISPCMVWISFGATQKHWTANNIKFDFEAHPITLTFNIVADVCFYVGSV